MKIVKTNKREKTTEVVLDGTYVTKEDIKELLKTHKAVRFSYFGSEYENFKQVNDMLEVTIILKDNYIAFYKRKGVVL